MVVLQALLGSTLPVQDVPEAVSWPLRQRQLADRHLQVLMLHSCSSLSTLQACIVFGTIFASLLRLMLQWISLSGRLPGCREIVA